LTFACETLIIERKLRVLKGIWPRKKEGGVLYMGYDGIKLVYFDGKPQWLMPDGSFLPTKRREGKMFSPCSLYLKDRALGESRLIVD
jgi:hypothetical protein